MKTKAIISALSLTASAMGFALATVPTPSFAGDRENAIVATCIAQGGDAWTIAACTGGLLTAQEVDTCIRSPGNCFGRNNTVRIILTDPGRVIRDAGDSIRRSDLNPGNWRW